MEKLLSSDRIKAEALRLGFSACGLAPAEAVDETVATAFRQWLADGCQAEMAYMQNYEDKRLDPRLLVEGARTVISVALNYYPAKKLPEGEFYIAPHSANANHPSSYLTKKETVEIRLSGKEWQSDSKGKLSGIRHSHIFYYPFFCLH